MSSSILEQYLSAIKVYQNRLPINYWFEAYFRAAFCMARVHDGDKSNCVSSMYCFLESLTKIVPNERWRHEFKKFLLMTPDVVKTIFNIEQLRGFFNVYGFMQTVILNSPQDLLRMCLKNNDAMFMYIYIMYCYTCHLKNLEGVYSEIPSYNQVRNAYNPNVLTKASWGPSIWFIIHSTALYMPSKIDESMFKDYVKFLECLRDILPCEICRSHLKENLQFIQFDSCSRDNLSLFKCSYDLHNIVNRSLNKVEPSINESISFYVPGVMRSYH